MNSYYLYIALRYFATAVQTNIFYLLVLLHEPVGQSVVVAWEVVCPVHETENGTLRHRTSHRARHCHVFPDSVSAALQLVGP